MTALCEKENISFPQSETPAIPVRPSGNHRTPRTFWFVVMDGRTVRAVLTRYRRRRLIRLGYACPVRSGCDRYPEALPECTVTIDDGAA